MSNSGRWLSCDLHSYSESKAVWDPTKLQYHHVTSESFSYDSGEEREPEYHTLTFPCFIGHFLLDSVKDNLTIPSDKTWLLQASRSWTSQKESIYFRKLIIVNSFFAFLRYKSFWKALIT